jgi:hypothetical protein
MFTWLEKQCERQVHRPMNLDGIFRISHPWVQRQICNLLTLALHPLVTSHRYVNLGAYILSAHREGRDTLKTRTKQLQGWRGQEETADVRGVRRVSTPDDAGGSPTAVGVESRHNPCLSPFAATWRVAKVESFRANCCYHHPRVIEKLNRLDNIWGGVQKCASYFLFV